MKYINPFAFFIALFVGLMICYATAPIPEIILKYPTPDNAGKVVYKDDADICYKYKLKKVKCPSDDQIDSFKVQKMNIIEKNNEKALDRLKAFINK
jgi:hypothetical protein